MKHEIDPDRAKPTGNGYFTEDPSSREAGCDPDVERCAPDDYDADEADDRNVPGTQDDLPYSTGEQLPDPADEHIVLSDAPVRTATRKKEKGESEVVGAADEADLWRRQKHLIQEDEDDGIKLEGFTDDEAAQVLEAIGEDAADPLQGSPNGVSATGSPFEPEHGGFPERSE